MSLVAIYCFGANFIAVIVKEIFDPCLMLLEVKTYCAYLFVVFVGMSMNKNVRYPKLPKSCQIGNG